MCRVGCKTLTQLISQSDCILLCAAGGYVFRPNYIHAAEMVLRDFRAGLLGQFNLDVDLLKTDCIPSTIHSPVVGRTVA